MSDLRRVAVERDVCGCMLHLSTDPGWLRLEGPLEVSGCPPAKCCFHEAVEDGVRRWRPSGPSDEVRRNGFLVVASSKVSLDGLDGCVPLLMSLRTDFHSASACYLDEFLFNETIFVLLCVE